MSVEQTSVQAQKEEQPVHSLAKEKLADKKEAAASVPAKEVEPPKASAKTETAKEKVAAKKEEKKVEYILQRKAVIPLFDAYAKPAKKRAARAVKLVRAYAARHAKCSEEKVKIDAKLAGFINCRGSKRPPKRLKVALLKDKQGNVRVAPA